MKVLITDAGGQSPNISAVVTKTLMELLEIVQAHDNEEEPRPRGGTMNHAISTHQQRT